MNSKSVIIVRGKQKRKMTRGFTMNCESGKVRANFYSEESSHAHLLLLDLPSLVVSDWKIIDARTSRTSSSQIYHSTRTVTAEGRGGEGRAHRTPN